MQHNATDPDSGGVDVSPTQVQALSALAEGATVTAAAETAGVDRTTVHRWLRDDASFRAAWNRLRREKRREVASRLDRLTEIALDTVHTALEAGDTRVAVAVLRGVGVLDGRSAAIGPDDAEVLREEADLAREESQALRRQRRLLAF